MLNLQPHRTQVPLSPVSQTGPDLQVQDVHQGRRTLLCFFLLLWPRPCHTWAARSSSKFIQPNVSLFFQMFYSHFGQSEEVHCLLLDPETRNPFLQEKKKQEHWWVEVPVSRIWTKVLHLNPSCGRRCQGWTEEGKTKFSRGLAIYMWARDRANLEKSGASELQLFSACSTASRVSKAKPRAVAHGDSCCIPVPQFTTGLPSSPTRTSRSGLCRSPAGRWHPHV